MAKVVEIGRNEELELWKQPTTDIYGGEKKSTLFDAKI